MNDKPTVVDEFVEAVCQLSKANRLTGIWDNRRFQECKKSPDLVDHAFVYKTEKLSRKNVELRAVYRTQIDVAFEKLMSEPDGACTAKTKR